MQCLSHKADKLCATLPIIKGSIMIVIEELTSWRSAYNWVPQILKWIVQRGKQSNHHWLHQYDAGVENFLWKIVCSDETWVCSFECRSKNQSMAKHYRASWRKMKFKNVASSGKIVATVSWDEKDFILMHLLLGTAVNSYCIIGTLRSLIACLCHILSWR